MLLNLQPIILVLLQLILFLLQPYMFTLQPFLLLQPFQVAHHAAFTVCHEPILIRIQLSSHRATYLLNLLHVNFPSSY
jgi:hypothetical protein